MAEQKKIDSRDLEIPDGIYKAPDIRKQTLEQAEERIADKRVKRLIMAAKHSETVLQKSTKLLEKHSKQWNTQNEMFNKALFKMEQDIEKLEMRLHKMNEINSNITNIEGVINDNS